MTRTFMPALAALTAGFVSFASPVWAVQIAFDVRSATNDLLGNGFIDYNASALTGSGFETLRASNGLTLFFTALAPGLSGNFTIADDDDFASDFTVAQFFNGVPVGLNYLVTGVSAPDGFGFASSIESLDNTSILIGADPGTAFGFYTGSSFGTGTLAFTSGSGTAIPEPSVLGGAAMVAGVALGLGLKRRRVAAGLSRPE